jgi:hypothetical protein
LEFAPTGGWTLWGKVFTDVMLLDGENTFVLTTTGSEGANIDAIEVYPHDDDELGSAFVVVDNSHTTYVNGRQIGVGNHWDTTDACAAPSPFSLPISFRPFLCPFLVVHCCPTAGPPNQPLF